jgi:Na+-translocating ferredoxin:NAD+ oxidoreductase subunit B
MSFSITIDCKGCQACVRNCPTQAISGERHEVHRIDPARCIECGTCGRVCPYSAVAKPDGTIAERLKRSDWDRPVIDRKTCVSCGLCITICPVSCLSFDEEAGPKHLEPYPYLQVPLACVGCGFCESICPVGAIKLLPRSIVQNP